MHEAGHIFVVHGDLTKLACDLVLVPTDAFGLVPSRLYGTDPRVRAVMIEINRRLYMDEATGAKLAGFADFRALVRDALRDLMTAYADHHDQHL